MKSSASLFTAITAATPQGFACLWSEAMSPEISERKACGYSHHLNKLNTRDERPGFQGLT